MSITITAFFLWLRPSLSSSLGGTVRDLLSLYCLLRMCVSLHPSILDSSGVKYICQRQNWKIDKTSAARVYTWRVGMLSLVNITTVCGGNQEGSWLNWAIITWHMESALFCLFFYSRNVSWTIFFPDEESTISSTFTLTGINSNKKWNQINLQDLETVWELTISIAGTSYFPTSTISRGNMTSRDGLIFFPLNKSRWANRTLLLNGHISSCCQMPLNMKVRVPEWGGIETDVVVPKTNLGIIRKAMFLTRLINAGIFKDWY